MGYPVQTTTIYPTPQLTIKLTQLAQLAVLAELINNQQLFNQAETAYNGLVDSYNGQLPKPKKKGFFSQLIDNITFQDLNTTIAPTLCHLRESADYSSMRQTYSHFSKSDAIEGISMILLQLG